jgi:chromosome segregation ATPase
VTRKATVVSAAFARQLEHQIASLQLTVSDKDDAIKRIVRERDEMRTERDAARRRVDELQREIIGLRADLSSWKADAKTSDQNTALAEEKYKVALEIFKTIFNKETF